MTNPVSEFGTRSLDFTGDSVQLVTRKGADLLWIHRFQDAQGQEVDITNWRFTRVGGVGGGAVRNGVDAMGNALLEPIDIVTFQSDTGDVQYNIASAQYTASNTTLVLGFTSLAERPDPTPTGKFYQVIVGLQTFNFNSSQVSQSGTAQWTIAIDDPMGNLSNVNDSQGYILHERDHDTFGRMDAIQCYFKTSDLNNVNPSSGRSNNAPFEIEASIPTGRDDSGGNEIMLTQVIAAGIITVYSDVYTSPNTP